jgi:hypothetical protein
VKKAAKKRVEAGCEAASVLRRLFRSFTKLAERAGEGRPLLRGLRVGHDPAAERIVIVHGGSRVEFLLVASDGEPAHADVECRRMEPTGVTEKDAIASIRFNATGEVLESSVPELVGENIAQANGAWSIVAAVVWKAMQGSG